MSAKLKIISDEKKSIMSLDIDKKNNISKKIKKKGIIVVDDRNNKLILDHQSIIKANDIKLEHDKQFVLDKKLIPDFIIQYNDKNNNKQLNVLDLFCGCGGMTTGLVKAGLNVMAGIDIWNKAIESYEANHDHLAICADLTKLRPEDFKRKYNFTANIDVIVGGPPCQGFSIAGKRDQKDPRNSLFMEFCKYLDYFKPNAFIMENVMGILSMKTANKESVIDIVMEKLGTDYNCKINKLYASDFRVPQNRRRVIIIGIKKELNIIPLEIKPILEKDKRVAVKTILEKESDVDKKYFLSEKAINGINAKKAKSKADGKGFGAQYLKLDEPSYTIPARYWKDGYDALVKYDDKKIRRLTISELKKIQSFPDNYVLKGSNKEIIIQIGNAVACEFANYLGKYIINTLQ